MIDPPFRDTPQFEAAVLGERLECRPVVKVETFNPIRSFKARGAQFFVSELAGRPRLVCCSSGNFGQGMAYAARQRGLALTVFMNAPSNPLKEARMRALGADVRVIGSGDEDALAAALRFAAEHDALMVVDGDEPAIAEGAGTIALELLRWPEPFDAILVPLGDGALLSGISCWCQAHSPNVRTIGVCAAGSPAMERSWRAGRVVSAPAGTIAEGISVDTPRAPAVANLAVLADEVILVEDAALIAAMRLAHRDIGVVLEPSGAAALAALAMHSDRFRGQRIGIVLTGSNVSPEQMRQWL
ncbi:MAG TPA: pyridoxal-phosphate dependent enzyme [Steroidobacteraceae bacterium]